MDDGAILRLYRINIANEFFPSLYTTYVSVLEIKQSASKISYIALIMYFTNHIQSQGLTANG